MQKCNWIHSEQSQLLQTFMQPYLFSANGDKISDLHEPVLVDTTILEVLKNLFFSPKELQQN